MLGRARPAGRALRLRSRAEVEATPKVGFEELAPEAGVFLGQVAYLQLGYFETLSELIAATPDFLRKEAISRAAGAALLKHRELVLLIRERGEDPTLTMLPFREPLDAFRVATRGVRPPETMLSVHITAGLLDDFSLALSEGYGETGRRVARILGADTDREALIGILSETIAADEEWASLLALWGRRLVGDTLLVARSVLRESAPAAVERVEPVFTQLMAAHAERMAGLGLAP
ncbi:MAG: ferritin-like fold-containing protein [Microbacterium sp.]|uniref:ferritin-like fold-containing protein n=1 Tax=Microbacterium sp. TaxID=51671 RepID=UPI0039E47763